MKVIILSILFLSNYLLATSLNDITPACKPEVLKHWNEYYSKMENLNSSFKLYKEYVSQRLQDATLAVSLLNEMKVIFNSESVLGSIAYQQYKTGKASREEFESFIRINVIDPVIRKNKLLADQRTNSKVGIYPLFRFEQLISSQPCKDEIIILIQAYEPISPRIENTFNLTPDFPSSTTVQYSHLAVDCSNTNNTNNYDNFIYGIKDNNDVLRKHFVVASLNYTNLKPEILRTVFNTNNIKAHNLEKTIEDSFFNDYLKNIVKLPKNCYLN